MHVEESSVFQYEEDVLVSLSISLTHIHTKLLLRPEHQTKLQIHLISLQSRDEGPERQQSSPIKINSNLAAL